MNEEELEEYVEKITKQVKDINFALLIESLMVIFCIIFLI